jgi:nucleotide-binding universal stress UspA family protein
MHAEALTPLVKSLPPLRVFLMLAGLLLVETSVWAGAMLWGIAAATVVGSVVIARELDRRRPPLAAVIGPGASDDEMAPQKKLVGAGDSPAPTPLPRTAEVSGPSGPATGRSVACGVDGSAESKTAVAVAARLATSLGAKLVLAHVIDARAADRVPVLSGGVVGPSGPGLHTEEHGRTAAALVAQSAVAAVDGVECRVAVGFTADRLADLAEEEQAELLVVGSRGRGGLKSAFLGSVSRARRFAPALRRRSAGTRLEARKRPDGQRLRSRL